MDGYEGSSQNSEIQGATRSNRSERRIDPKIARHITTRARAGDRFEEMDTNRSIRTRRSAEKTLYRIDDISRSTSPNAMKFSQKLTYMLKNVLTKFQLHQMNS